MSQPQVIDRAYMWGDTVIVIGQPGSYDWLPDDHQSQHNCDAMGCGSIGPHVLARIKLSDLAADGYRPPQTEVMDRWTVKSVLTKHNLWRDLAGPIAAPTAITLQKQDMEIDRLKQTVNTLLAFFNPTYERPEALEV